MIPNPDPRRSKNRFINYEVPSPLFVYRRMISTLSRGVRVRAGRILLDSLRPNRVSMA